MRTELPSTIYLVILATGRCEDYYTKNIASYSERCWADLRAKNENRDIGMLVGKKECISTLMTNWKTQHTADHTSEETDLAYDAEYKRLCDIIGFNEEKLPMYAMDYFHVYVEEVALNP